MRTVTVSLTSTSDRRLCFQFN